MSKRDMEFEQPNKIVEIVQKSLDSSKQNQEGQD